MTNTAKASSIALIYQLKGWGGGGYGESVQYLFPDQIICLFLLVKGNHSSIVVK